MKIVFLLLFILGCNCRTQEKVIISSGDKMTALGHLRQARLMLRNEEGHLMVMGRSLTDQEQKRYDLLLKVGEKVTIVISDLE